MLTTIRPTMCSNTGNSAGVTLFCTGRKSVQAVLD